MALASAMQSCTLGTLALRNRVAMAPMTRCFSPGGVPGADVARYYRRRAEGGVGLIITEGTAIDHPAAISEPRIPRFHGEAALAGWRVVREQVQAAGARIFPQLWHVGAARKPEISVNPQVHAVSPSGLFARDQANGCALGPAEIDALIAAYGDAASSALRIGFDGIELHFAHGYLVDQFLWDETNRRSDAWGADRTAFARQIVAECRRRTAPDFPICVRFSQWKQQDYAARLFDTPDRLGAFLAVMVDAGADIFHCSSRRFWMPEFDGSPLNLAGWTRKLSGKPVITVGSVGLDEEFLISRTGAPTGADHSRLAHLDAMLARGDVDIVAIGRALLADAAWLRKVTEDRLDEIIPYSKERESTLA